MLSLKVHYKNKYPKGTVQVSNHGLDVFDEQGEHRISMEKNGAGQLVDVSEAEGLPDRHDLAPIPKDARLYKVVGGSIVKDDKFAEREKGLSRFMMNGRVLSCDELQYETVANAEGKLVKQQRKNAYVFNPDTQVLISAPAAEASAQ